MTSPKVVVLAGINGAGKTTASKWALAALRIPIFVNADAIARGLNGLNPEAEAVRAGRIMLKHLDELAEARENFALETTLAARSYAGWLAGLKASGYEVYLFYYWLNSPELAINRVAERVEAGGHHIPDATVRQRYARSVRNFFELYRPVVTEWRVYDNTEKQSRLIVFGRGDREHVLDEDTWFDIGRSANHA